MTETKTVPVEPTREMRLAMQRALLDNYPEIIGGEVYTNGRLETAIYAAGVAAAPSPQVGREELARIIDPDVMRRGSDGRYVWSADVRSFPLAKADAILSLINGGN